MPTQWKVKVSETLEVNYYHKAELLLEENTYLFIFIYDIEFQPLLIDM